MQYLKNGELSLKLGGFTIRGKSVAGCETSLIIEELSTVFDMGLKPNKLESINNILISHGHKDHIGCLHYCHACKNLAHITNKWQIIMPECYIKPYQIFATASSSLGKGGYPSEFKKCKYEGDEKEYDIIKPYEKFSSDFLESEKCKYHGLLGNNKYFVSAHEMKHKITSFGYVIYELRKKLKAEYSHLKGNDLKILRESNIVIQEDIYAPIISFSGDTVLQSILDNNDFLISKILILECTHFLDSTIEEAESNGHVHFQQFLDNIHKFKNDWIVLTHFSQKYKTYDDIKKYIELLPDEYSKKVICWI